MQQITVFHHDDPDGIFSAAIIKKYYNEKDVEINYVKCSYPYIPDVSDVIGDYIYIVDYSPGTITNLVKLLENRTVVLIDHHTSTYEKFKNFKHENFIYKYNFNVTSACMQVWKFFYDIDPPKLLEYISDYDCWSHKFEESKYVFFTTSLITTVTSAYDLLLFDRLIDETIIQGKGIFKFIKSNGRRRSFTSVIFNNKYKICLKNTDIKSSYYFTEEQFKEYDICCIYSLKDLDRVSGSFYSTKINVGKILSEMSIGGGHAGAAGFNITLQKFNELFIKEDINA